MSTDTREAPPRPVTPRRRRRGRLLACGLLLGVLATVIVLAVIAPWEDEAGPPVPLEVPDPDPTSDPEPDPEPAPPARESLAPLSVRASADDGNVPENTLDGDLTTRWAANGDGAWIAYDLGAPYALESVDIAFHQGDRRTAGFTVQTSPDGSTWTPVLTGQSSGTTLEAESFELTETAGRHVRIVGHGNSASTWNSFTHVAFHGAELPDATGVTPVAVTASAHDGNLPENTLDGDLATRWSANGHGAWISYDLGGLYALGSLDVAFHQGDRRSANFTVRTSTDGQQWATVYTGTSSGETLEPEEHRFTDAAVRHVRIVGQGNSDNAWNSVTLVEFGGAHGEEIAPPAPPSSSYSGASGVLPAGQEIVNVTFDLPTTPAPISASTLQSLFETSPPVDFQWAGDKNRSMTAIVRNPDGPGNVLRVRIPADRLHTGALYPIRIGDERGYDEVWLQYRVRFGDGFQFVRGGKLPGLSGGPGSGPEPRVPHGGRRNVTGDNGFSARHHWYAEVLPPGYPHLRQYVYHPDRSSSAGDAQLMEGAAGVTRLVDNRWYTITQRVVMNTPGRDDGIIEGWIDGQRHYRRTDFNFRSTDRWGINMLHFHVYFGGSSSRWAHSRDEDIFLDDVRVIVP